MKRILLRALKLPGASLLLKPLLRGRATVFMLHRFTSPDRGVEGHDPDALKATLAMLRKERYRIISVADVLERLIAHEPLERCVAFTVDDGYADHAEVGASIFAEFDCPATIFVTTGFLDGLTWFWWDRIDFVLRETRRATLTVPLPNKPQVLERSASGSWRSTKPAFVARLKEIPDDDKEAAIRLLADQADVDVPRVPPDRYAPMTWSQLRFWEKRGLFFGPHTVTHPVLSRTTAERSRWEIAESWRRLREEAVHAIPIFCYPNGQTRDFSVRETRTLEAEGLSGAVVGTPGYAGTERKGTVPERFRRRRFSCPEDQLALQQIISGFERLKQVVRREAEEE